MVDFDTKPLRTLYESGRLLPFVGAGVSMSVSWEVAGVQRRGPSWSELVDTAAAMVGFDDAHLLRARGEDLQILEYCRARLDDQLAPLRHQLRDQLDAPDSTLRASTIHAALAAMTCCDLMYTTNYDNYLERALGLSGRTCIPVATEANLAKYLRACENGRKSDRPCRVVKFHGDLDNPEQMVLSDSDYRERLRFSTPLDALLRADLLGRAVLFLGYSFRDWNVSYLFHLVGRDFGDDLPDIRPGYRAYITVPDPSDFEYRLFESRKIGVIPIERDYATSEITELLTEIADC